MAGNGNLIRKFDVKRTVTLGTGIRVGLLGMGRNGNQRPRNQRHQSLNAWNALPASAFDCDSVSGFKRFLANYDLSQFLYQ